MECDIYTLRDGSGNTVRSICVIENPDVPGERWEGCGPTKDAAVLDAFAKAAEESVEARAELGLLLGVRGDGRGGRPNGS